MKYGRTIESALDGATSLIVGKINSSSHCEIIQNIFRPYGAKVRIATDDLVTPGTIVVTGQNAQWKVRQSIEIYLAYHPKARRVLVTESLWKQLKFDLSQTLQHELIHRMQCSYMTVPSEDWIDHNPKVYASKAKIPKKKEAQEYLGSTDEIEAHAHCIMMDLRYNFPRTDSIKLLKQAKKNPKAKSTVLKNYLETFDYDMSHPVLKRLFKETVYWIENPEA